MKTKAKLEDMTPDQKRALLKRLIQERTTVTAPLSYGQRAIWYEQQLIPAMPVFNIAFGLRILSELDVTALQRSLQKILDRHDSLRTTYHFQGQNLYQHIHFQKKMNMLLHDTSGESEKQFSDIIHNTAYRPFALDKEPLMRADLFWREPGRHLLLLSFHHIAVDTWSLVLIIKDFLFFYSEARADRPPSSMPMPTAYTRFVQWQHDMLNGQEGKRLWRYWQNKLSGGMRPVELPCDDTPKDLPDANGKLASFRLEPTLTHQLRDMAIARSVTLYTVLLAAFCTLLYRYSRQQEDLYIGTIAAGRDQAQFADTVGFFANPVVLHAKLSDNPQFTDFLARLNTTVQEAIAHQGLPFPLLLEKMGIGPHARRDHLSDIMFIMESSHHLRNTIQSDASPETNTQFASGIFTPGDTGKRIVSDGLNIEGYSLNRLFTQNDLAMEIAAGEDISGALHYRTSLFRPETIETMAEHYQRILKSAVSQPECRVGDLDLLSDEERHRILVHWNDTDADFSGSRLVHGLISDQAGRTPEREALRFQDRRWTYLELERESNRLSNYLIYLGIKKEGIIALHMDRSPKVIIAMLAALKAGAAFLPLDPQYPAERLCYILENAAVSVVITDGRWPFPLDRGDYKRIDLERHDSQIKRFSDAPSETVISGDQLAYVFYTSGSTGFPKGVMVEHHSVVNMIGSFNHSYRLRPADRVLQQAPLFFDVCIGEIFPVLSAGGTLCIPSPDDLVSMESRLRFIADNAITVLAATPSLLSLYNTHAEQLPSLRLILSGGEALALTDIGKLTGRVTITNGYGLTETTVCSTYHTLGGEEDKGWDAFHRIPVGRPIANTTIRILDTRGNLLPAGVPGEIYIGGNGVARGYLNNPELTAERFIPDPFDREGKRLFRTGDLGRYRVNGDIEFLGRIDQQLKIRGLRIEPGEIEANLMQHPGLRDALVILHEQKPGQKRLIGYLVPEKDQGVDTSNIRSFLNARLPDYMVPTTFVILDHLPLTLSGKVDNQSLPLPDFSEETEYVAPRDEIESALAQIWQEVLQIESVGVKSHFFELGGNSLRGIQIIGAANAIGLKVNPSDLIANPTIADLAAVCRHGAGGISVHTYLAPLAVSKKKPALFLTPALTGLGLCYLELLRLLPKNQAVYAFQNPGIYGERQPFDTMTDLTRFFLKQLDALDTTGPYLLGGFSFGGASAFALAQEMESTGRDVRGVFLLEAGLPGKKFPIDGLTALYAYISAHGPLEVPLEGLQALPERACFDYLLASGKRNGILPENITPDMVRHVLNVAHGNALAFQEYTPKGRLKAPVYYFRAQSGPAEKIDPAGFYEKYAAGPITIIPTPGDHFQILNPPHVKNLARLLSNAIYECKKQD